MFPITPKLLIRIYIRDVKRGLVTAQASSGGTSSPVSVSNDAVQAYLAGLNADIRELVKSIGILSLWEALINLSTFPTAPTIDSARTLTLFLIVGAPVQLPDEGTLELFQDTVVNFVYNALVAQKCPALKDTVAATYRIAVGLPPSSPRNPAPGRSPSPQSTLNAFGNASFAQSLATQQIMNPSSPAVSVVASSATPQPQPPQVQIYASTIPPVSKTTGQMQALFNNLDSSIVGLTPLDDSILLDDGSVSPSEMPIEAMILAKNLGLQERTFLLAAFALNKPLTTYQTLMVQLIPAAERMAIQNSDIYRRIVEECYLRIGSVLRLIVDYESSIIDGLGGTKTLKRNVTLFYMVTQFGGSVTWDNVENTIKKEVIERVLKPLLTSNTVITTYTLKAVYPNVVDGKISAGYAGISNESAGNTVSDNKHVLAFSVKPLEGRGRKTEYTVRVPFPNSQLQNFSTNQGLVNILTTAAKGLNLPVEFADKNGNGSLALQLCVKASGNKASVGGSFLIAGTVVPRGFIAIKISPDQASGSLRRPSTSLSMVDSYLSDEEYSAGVPED